MPSNKIIVCDLDGTLCDITHRLHYVKRDTPDYDTFFAECVNDKPNYWCIELVECMALAGHDTVFVSGRSDQVRKETEAWIDSHIGFGYELYMRQAGDHQPDYKLKESIYEQHLKDRDILFVIDDRQQVVDMWRDKGLTVLQCAKGDF